MVYAFLAAGLLLVAPAAAQISTTYSECTPEVLKSAEMFNCLPGPNGLPPLEYGPASSYFDGVTRAAFPQSWHQFAYNQRHNPQFPVTVDAPAFVREGRFWAAPITGMDFLYALQAIDSFSDPESWAARTAQFLGTVMGVSVANGIVYAQLGRHEIAAMDGEFGHIIWRTELVNVAGMGQAIVDQVGGRPVVFVPVGDAAFNIQNVVDFNNGQAHDRGAGFGAVYALDGLTGEQLWRVNTKGAARPAPIYHNGLLYVATAGGEFLVLDAATGAEISRFTNPGEGFPGLASPNWYETPDGRRLVLYGTLRPRRIVAVDVTNPKAPALGWEFTPPNAASNAPGDTPVAVDPQLGMLFTTVFSSINGSNDVQVMALDAATGALVWNQRAGAGDNPPGFKGSVPMIHEGNLYVGNTINATFQSYDAKTGAVRWVTPLANPNDPPDTLYRPRGAAAYYEGKIIQASGQHVRTLDAASGAILNDFRMPRIFSAFGVAQPIIIGKQMYLSSISGWIYGVPVDYITTSAGFSPDAVDPSVLASLPRPPSISNPRALPGPKDVIRYPATWLSYAGGPTNNAVVADGPRAFQWRTPLNDALPLDGPPLDEGLYGTEIATQMTHHAFGVGSGLAVAQGVVYAGSDRFSVNAVNAKSGELIWRFRTFSGNFGQPLVTPDTVVVGGGDPWLSLGNTGRFTRKESSTTVGASLQYLHGLDPKTGDHKWTYYSGAGTSALTPLYDNGKLYWASGQAKVFAVDAATGTPVAPLMDGAGKPVLDLGGFNANSSANLYRSGDGTPLMIVGTALPNQITAVNLATASVAWTQNLAGFSTHVTGFAASSTAVDQAAGVIVGTVLIDVDSVSNTATVLAYGLDAATGAVLWTQAIGSGPVPAGIVAPTPVLADNQAFIHNPIANSAVALEVNSGIPKWQRPAVAAPGKYSWGPAAVTAEEVIVPAGDALLVLDKQTGATLNQFYVGGALTYHNPVIIGKTLYIGNSWGWVLAYPLATVVGGG